MRCGRCGCGVPGRLALFLRCKVSATGRRTKRKGKKSAVWPVPEAWKPRCGVLLRVGSCGVSGARFPALHFYESLTERLSCAGDGRCAGRWKIITRGDGKSGSRTFFSESKARIFCPADSFGRNYGKRALQQSFSAATPLAIANIHQKIPESKFVLTFVCIPSVLSGRFFRESDTIFRPLPSGISGGRCRCRRCHR